MAEKCTHSKVLIKALLKLQLYMIVGFAIVLLPLYLICILRHSGVVSDQILLFVLFTVVTTLLLYIWYRATNYLVAE
ncbi:MAG TPA: hypothetical protein EYH02_02920 [Ignisphaera aggregans]|uniref:Uncharacterized protein n=1 Tax=Ignisphaera aggregans TaxID=334771 RepID=A0A833DT72_9CREN|nr:hypothetical protein [Ignisphaera aggregans]